METDELTGKIIGAAMKVHRVLGTGFVESVYEKALLHEFRKEGVCVESQKPLLVYYDGIVVGEFVADIIVEKRVVVELKAIQCLGQIHEVQTVNYLTATKLDTGLLINFGAASLEFKRKFRTNPSANKPFSL
ncbi:GxxExxY protein [Pedosphaera parvula]|uniref:GxxExxY protein n=1 Tax=Pedosphaera parvula (strain Ellin514) TaxID=320771 RepID=B9XKJ8_PEDPL|nr:GxxExxY protein [Pedosphaera parvula]EEF59668.1 conserved hypothetical protein [Pedosphaera parvula Ellin514]